MTIDAKHVKALLSRLREGQVVFPQTHLPAMQLIDIPDKSSYTHHTSTQCDHRMIETQTQKYSIRDQLKLYVYVCICVYINNLMKAVSSGQDPVLMDESSSTCMTKFG